MICFNLILGLDSYCENRREFIRDDRDEGSFGSHVTWDADTLHVLPENLRSEYAGPLMCGGATVWGALSFIMSVLQIEYGIKTGRGNETRSNRILYHKGIEGFKTRPQN
jgi:D-arabinose 1-dehydrogenase-like Zn-dependent alcohol dehydrogenase